MRVTTACSVNITDPNVPLVNGGFCYLQVGTLGALNGSLYTTTNYGPSPAPYMFNIAPRDPFLNPYICLYYNSVTVLGGVPWYAGDTLAITPGGGESADGGSVLGNADGNILSVSPGGGVALLGRNPGNYRGRPIRWHAPSSLQLAAAGQAAAAAAGDTTLGALVLRADTLVHVLVTDPAGRRIGVTASDSVVNDFGSAGMVKALGPNGWPLLITILGPANGNHRIDITGAGSGDYGVTAYLAETSTGGVKSPITATIGSGEHQLRFLSVTNPLTLSWQPASTGVGDRPLATAAGFDAVGPIPASDFVRFAWHTHLAGSARLEIFDLAGRRVATLANGPRAPGRFTTEWSGRNDDGHRLGAGVYLARLSLNGVTQVRRVVLTR